MSSLSCCTWACLAPNRLRAVAFGLLTVTITQYFPPYHSVPSPRFALLGFLGRFVLSLHPAVRFMSSLFFTPWRASSLVSPHFCFSSAYLTHTWCLSVWSFSPPSIQIPCVGQASAPAEESPVTESFCLDLFLFELPLNVELQSHELWQWTVPCSTPLLARLSSSGYPACLWQCQILPSLYYINLLWIIYTFLCYSPFSQQESACLFYNRLWIKEGQMVETGFMYLRVSACLGTLLALT